jgi:hypothetical protein
MQVQAGAIGGLRNALAGTQRFDRGFPFALAQVQIGSGFDRRAGRRRLAQRLTASPIPSASAGRQSSWRLASRRTPR